jgi:colicin import membrane protein
MSQYALPSFLQSISALAQHNKVSAKAARAKQSAKAKRAKEHSSRRARSLKEQRARDKLLDQLVKIAAQKSAKADRLAAKEAAKAAKKAAKEAAKAERLATKTAAKEADKAAKKADKAAKKAANRQLLPATAHVTANRSAATQPSAPSKPLAAKTKKLIIKDNRNADRADLIQTLCDNFNHTSTLPNSRAIPTN